MSIYGRFSNRAYSEMTPAEKQRQFEMLAPLQKKHSKELLENGVAHRAIGSLAVSNTVASKEMPSVDITATPKRWAAWNRADTDLAALELDIVDGINKILLPHFREKGHPCHELNIEITEHHDQGPKKNDYVVGVELSEQAAYYMDLHKFQPVPGFTVQDVALVSRQLEEVRQFKQANNLTIVDDITLSVGLGELLTDLP